MTFDWSNLMVTTHSGHSPANVTLNPKLCDGLRAAGATTLFLIALLAWKTWGVLFLGDLFDVGQTLLLLLIIFSFSSFKEVRADEVGAAFFYGKALVKLDSGLHFIPLGLVQIRKGPRPVQQFQCPGEPEKVQKTGDDAPLQDGMVRPIRVVTGGSNAASTDTTLNSRMTIILSFFVQWSITDVFDYISNYGSSEEVEKQVRDIGEAILAETAVKHSPASFIDSLPSINGELTEGVTERFKNSGVTIISIRLISPDVSHGVSTALAAIPEARAKAEQAKITAEGEKVKLTKEGEGKAAAKLAMLTADADGRKKIMKALGVNGDAVLASETVAGILDKTDVLVMGQGGTADAMGLVKAAQIALNSGKTKGVQP